MAHRPDLNAGLRSRRRPRQRPHYFPPPWAGRGGAGSRISASGLRRDRRGAIGMMTRARAPCALGSMPAPTSARLWPHARRRSVVVRSDHRCAPTATRRSQTPMLRRAAHCRVRRRNRAAEGRRNMQREQLAAQRDSDAKTCARCRHASRVGAGRAICILHFTRRQNQEYSCTVLRPRANFASQRARSAQGATRRLRLGLGLGLG